MKMNFIFFMTFIIILPKISVCDKNSIENKLRNSNKDGQKDVLVKCVSNILRNHFTSTPTILVNSIQSADELTDDEFINKFTKELIFNGFPTIVSEDNFTITSMYMQEGYIVSIKYINDCKKIPRLQLKTFEDHIKYLIIVFDYSKKMCDKTLLAVGGNISTYDVTYIVNILTDDYSILTFVPGINVYTCSPEYNLEPTFLSTCGSENHFDPFPSKKLQNYMKCPFKVGMASLFPFSTITNKSELYTYKPLEENEIHGSDLETLKIMAQKFNMSLDFYFIYRAEENPYIDIDFLSFLLNGSLDICAGGLYRTYGDVIDYSGVYGRQAIIWMYAAKRETRSWQSLVQKVNGLYIFMIFYFLYTIVWKVLCIYDGTNVPMGRLLLHTWGALIGTSSLDKGSSFKKKILNLVYLIMCIYLSAYVSIQMFSFLTIVSPPTIYKTNTDIVQSGLRPYLMMKMKYFVSDSSYEAFANTSADCESFLDCEEKTLELNGMTIVIDGQFITLQAQTAVNDEAITLRVNENLLTVYHEMLLRKDVPITKSFQKLMIRLREAGISDRLYDEAIGILTKSKSEIANKNMLSHSYSCELGCSITLEQSAGAFYVWLFGSGLSFCIFLIEVFMKREINIV